MIIKGNISRFDRLRTVPWIEVKVMTYCLMFWITACMNLFNMHHVLLLCKANRNLISHFGALNLICFERSMLSGMVVLLLWNLQLEIFIFIQVFNHVFFRNLHHIDT